MTARRPAGRLLFGLMAAALWMPRPAQAQAPVDSAGLAIAVARFIADELVPDMDLVSEFVIGPAETRFDSLVAAEMARLPAFRRPARDSARAAEIHTHGVAEMPYAPEHLRGLPAVIVQVSGCTPSEGWRGWHWWSNQTWYVFQQTERGWEFAGARTLDNADGVCSPSEHDGR